MNRIGKITGFLLGSAVGLLGAGSYWLLRRPLAQTEGTLRLEGLTQEVEVIRDRWGVPHIYAQNLGDLMFAQGFVHAQDRLWQMDFQRRLVAGRLAEVMGQEALPVDRWLRTLGLARTADQEALQLDSDTYSLLQTYADGVNARIGRGRLPLEFTLLRHQPEPWRVVDTLYWIKMMAWSLSVNWESELLRARLIDRVGPELAAELEPAPAPPFIIPPGADYAKVGDEALRRASAARSYAGPSPNQGLGSNSWVIGGAHTATGAPLLANDMHLPLDIPAIWYENHLKSGAFRATGVTFPGIPGVVAGHNGRVAWGFTNGFSDVQDLYMERLRHTDDGRVQVQFRGEWIDAQIIREEIRVRGGETVVEEVILTHHGPIINNLAPDLAGEQPLALRWTALEPEMMIQGLVEMNQAQDCTAFREALRHWGTPVQNVIYADADGNIAYSHAGKVPIRAKGDGRLPVPGWTGEYEWTGTIPFEDLPHLYNPEPDFIISANNRVTDEHYPYELGYDFCTGDRAQRIGELIQDRLQAGERAAPGIDIPYIQRMHLDQVCPSARIVAQQLGQLEVEDPDLADVVALMRAWDGALDADSPAAAVYEVFVRQAISLLLRPRLGELAERYAGRGPTPFIHERSMLGHRAHEWLLRTLAGPSSHWFDLGGGETRDQILRLVLLETVTQLKGMLGPQIYDWAWGKLHTLTLSHRLSRVKLLEALLNRGPYPLGGDRNTIWATGTGSHDLSTRGAVGPPFRFVADLGDMENTLGLLLPGQSGQPGSRHYADQVEAWFTGHYHPMLFNRGDVLREAKGVLTLTPAKGV